MHKNLNSIKFPSRAYRPKTLSDFLIYVVGISSGDLVNMSKFEYRILRNIYFDFLTTAQNWEKDELLTNKISFLSLERWKINT